LISEFYFPSKIINKNYGLKNIKIKENYSKLLAKELYILNTEKKFFIKNINRFFENFLSTVKTYINTIDFPINVFNSNILKLNKFIINYIKFTRTFNFFTYGIDDLSILSTVCKNFNFLNIQLLEYEKKNNSISFARKIQLISTYYNQNHKSHFNFTYTKNISILENFIVKKKVTDFSTVIVVNLNNFPKIFFNKFIFTLAKQNEKISLIILKNDNYVKYKKIINFQYICEINGYLIFLNNKIFKKYNDGPEIKELFKKNKIKYLFYLITAYSSYFFGLLIKIKYYLIKKFSRCIIVFLKFISNKI
jgi:hypothetical protein